MILTRIRTTRLFKVSIGRMIQQNFWKTLTLFHTKICQSIKRISKVITRYSTNNGPRTNQEAKEGFSLITELKKTMLVSKLNSKIMRPIRHTSNFTIYKYLKEHMLTYGCITPISWLKQITIFLSTSPKDHKFKKIRSQIKRNINILKTQTCSLLLLINWINQTTTEFWVVLQGLFNSKMKMKIQVN